MILILPGGNWQFPIINYFKQFYPVCVVNPFPTETTNLADIFIQEDITNIKEVFQKTKHLNPLFVTSDQSDIATMPVALLSQMFDTPGNSPESISLFRNKRKMMEFAKDHIIPLSCEIPFIVKPVDANASRGFVKIDDYEDLDKKINYSLSFSPTKQVICQKYISGTVWILDGICSGGKHKTLAYAAKEQFRPGLTSCICYSESNKFLEEMIEFNDDYVERSGLSFGITHAEYIVNEEDFYFLEIAARGGGFLISSHIVPYVSGINTMEILHQNLLGNTTDVKSLKPLARKAKIQFYKEFPDKDHFKLDEERKAFTLEL